MQYHSLGRTGVKVSQLCFGTMSFGGDADEATSAQMFNRTRDAGINFHDTADAYAMGRSEEILDRLFVGFQMSTYGRGRRGYNESFLLLEDGRSVNPSVRTLLISQPLLVVAASIFVMFCFDRYVVFRFRYPIRMTSFSSSPS